MPDMTKEEILKEIEEMPIPEEIQKALETIIKNSTKIITEHCDNHVIIFDDNEGLSLSVCLQIT